MAVAAALLGYLVLRTERKPALPTKGTRPLLVGFAPEGVRAIVLTQKGSVLRLERQGGTWKVAGTADGAIGDDRVDQFLSAISNAEKLDENAGQDASLADFGLDPPRATVVLEGEAATRLAIGERNPALTGLYVQVAPDPRVVMVGSVLAWELEKLTALSTVRPAR